MSDIAIRIENLGKMYRIGRRQERYKRFTQTVMDTVSTSARRLRSFRKATPLDESIWALKDLCLQVKRGEALGIIGRNGAGKSTLLKVLSRITEPTSGRVELHGRVGSLLEVGTGFHPELTGRENICLNGAILGMRRAEIDARFDEIVAFAEVERFLDTPVKRYSSGMYVRLAFAVAAHMDTEILLVDEVLAVGDMQFQRKCIDRMGSVAGTGRTVLFVSHNMGAIKSLCDRTIVLSGGTMEYEGPTPAAIQRYLSASGDASACDVVLEDRYRRHASSDIRLVRATLSGPAGMPQYAYQYGDMLSMRIAFTATHPTRLAAEVFLKTALGERVACFATSHFHGFLIEAAPGENVVELQVPHLPLPVGTYSMDVGLSIPGRQWLDLVEDACHFEVSVSDPGSTGFKFQQGSIHGMVYIDHHWQEPGGAAHRSA